MIVARRQRWRRIPPVCTQLRGLVVGWLQTSGRNRASRRTRERSGSTVARGTVSSEWRRPAERSKVNEASPQDLVPVRHWVTIARLAGYLDLRKIGRAHV